MNDSDSGSQGPGLGVILALVALLAAGAAAFLLFSRGQPAMPPGGPTVPVTTGPKAVPSAAPKAQPSAEAALTPESLQTLVKDLGADDFDKRKVAETQLLKAGAQALGALKEAQASPDAQVKATAARLETRIRLNALDKVDYLDVIPAESFIFVQARDVNASLEAARKSIAGQLTYSKPLDPFRNMLEKALQKNPEGWEKMQVWTPRFKGQFAFALWSLDMRDPTKIRLAAIAEITDPAPKRVFDELLAEARIVPQAALNDTYKEIEIVNGGPMGPCFALVNRHLVFSANADSVKAVIDGMLAPGGLAASPAFQKIKPALGPKPELLFCMDFQVYMKEVVKMMGAMGPAGAGQAEAIKSVMNSAGNMKLMAVASSCVGTVFEDRYVLSTDGPPTGLAAAGIMPPGAPPPIEAMAIVPRNASIAAAGYMDGGRMHGSMMEYLSGVFKMARMGAPPNTPGPPDLEAVLKDFEGKTGLKVADLAGSIKGEFGYYVVPAPGLVTAAPDIGIFITCTDADKAKALSGAVSKALNAFMQPAPAAEVPQGARTVYQLDLAKLGIPVPEKFPYTPSWAAEGNRVFIASSPMALRKQLSYIEQKTPGLLAQPEFTKAMEQFTPEQRKGQVMYVNMRDLLTAGAMLGLPLLQGQIQDPEVMVALQNLPPPQDLFKDIPPLVAVSVQYPDRVESIMRSPVPSLPAMVGTFAIYGLFATRPTGPVQEAPGKF
jgi:hypothetical protein